MRNARSFPAELESYAAYEFDAERFKTFTLPVLFLLGSYLDGLRAGAFLRTGIGKDTLRLGNDALVMRFPTDLFSTGYNLLVQGASLGGGSGGSTSGGSFSGSIY